MNQKLLDEINEKLKAVMAQSPAADLERKHAQALAKLGVDPRMLSSEAGHG